MRQRRAAPGWPDRRAGPLVGCRWPGVYLPCRSAAAPFDLGV